MKKNNYRLIINCLKGKRVGGVVCVWLISTLVNKKRGGAKGEGRKLVYIWCLLACGFCLVGGVSNGDIID